MVQLFMCEVIAVMRMLKKTIPMEVTAIKYTFGAFDSLLVVMWNLFYSFKSKTCLLPWCVFFINSCRNCIYETKQIDFKVANILLGASMVLLIVLKLLS